MQTSKTKRFSKPVKAATVVLSIIATIKTIVESLATIKEKGPEALVILGILTYDAGLLFEALLISLLSLGLPAAILMLLQRFLRFSDEVLFKITALAFFSYVIYNIYAVITKQPMLFAFWKVSGYDPDTFNPLSRSNVIIFTRVLGVILLVGAGYVLYGWISEYLSSHDENENSSGS